MTQRRRHKKRHFSLIKWFYVMGSAGMMVLAGILCFGLWHHNRAWAQIDREHYPILGIDVSAYNGNIDFDKVVDDGVSFVYIKSSEGATFRDKKFSHNRSAADEAGLKVGAYHFFRKKVDGTKQAENFIAAVKGHELHMPLVIDVEDWGNDRKVDDATVIKNLKPMIRRLETAGYAVMLYTNGDGYKRWFKPHLNKHRLWLCSFKNPESLHGRDHDMQQFSHWGTVNGIDGEVDLNVFNGSRKQWEQWLEQF